MDVEISAKKKQTAAVCKRNPRNNQGVRIDCASNKLEDLLATLTVATRAPSETEVKDTFRGNSMDFGVKTNSKHRFKSTRSRSVVPLYKETKSLKVG